MTTKALVVLSGGQDSATCMAWARSMFDDVEAISFDYGQRHHKELEAAQRIAALHGALQHTVEMPILKHFFRSIFAHKKTSEKV